MEEIWKDIDGYKNHYQVSNFGNVRGKIRNVSNHTGFITLKSKILKQATNKKGYKVCYLSMNSKQKTIPVHRLVAKAFIDNPYKLPQVNHIDGIKSNNNVSNLEWCDNLYNQQHAIKLGLVNRSDKCGKPKIKVSKIDRYSLTVIETYNSIAEASRKNNLNKSNIASVIKGKRNYCGNYIWRKVGDK